MLLLKKIILTHFKNYDIRTFDFGKNVVGICGLNGKGKTNLLDAIFYCCFTKSYFGSSDATNAGFDKDGFRLEANFVTHTERKDVVCIHRNGLKKEFYLNDIIYEKLSKHIGILPAVMIAPDDIEIIIGNSEQRRRYIDTILCQLDADYLSSLIRYNKILQQRNSHLKQEAIHGKTDEALLEILDQQLTGPSDYIYQKRNDFSATLLPIVLQFYKNIASTEENIQIIFESSVKGKKIQDLLKENRQKDRALQRTTAGIHKDDLMFELNAHTFKNIASQGQKKSLLFALKLAEYEIIKNGKGFSPLLLLDDVFEKLDEKRIHNLMDWVCNKNNGHVFITDTHKDRLVNTFEELNIDAQIIEL
jgi:DNA replication and repair protein RecF